MRARDDRALDELVGFVWLSSERMMTDRKLRTNLLAQS
jgi:hypothetical protein